MIRVSREREQIVLVKHARRNEKAAPEILQFETALIQRSGEKIQLMEETVEKFSKDGGDIFAVSLPDGFG